MHKEKIFPHFAFHFTFFLVPLQPLTSRKRDVAQLVAHYVRDVGVGRSSRLIPTKGWMEVTDIQWLPFLLIVDLKNVIILFEINIIIIVITTASG